MRRYVGISFVALISILSSATTALNINNMFPNMMRGVQKQPATGSGRKITALVSNELLEWSDISAAVVKTATGSAIKAQEELREVGQGVPHTDAKLRLFGTTATPRLTYYRDTAAWCPYCQKVIIYIQ